MGRWSEVARRLKLNCPTGEDRRPTEDDLGRYEDESGIRLPLDYRRLAITHGPGSILDGSHEFDIAVPGLPEAGPYGDLATFNPPGGVPLCFLDCSDDELARLYATETRRGSDGWSSSVLFATWATRSPGTPRR